MRATSNQTSGKTLAFSKDNLNKLVPIDSSFITTVKAILHAAVERLHLVNAACMLRAISDQHHRYLVIGEDLSGVELISADAEEEFIVSTELPMAPRNTRLTTHELMSIPINMNDQRLGYLLASTRSAAISTGELQAGMAQLAHELLCLVQRYQTHFRIMAAYGRQPYWLGTSEALRKLDQLIAKLADAPMPVLIRGEKGTGKLLAARALHCHNRTDYTPFIESSCEEWDSATVGKILPELWAYAKGGTLFLRNIDRLEPEGFALLQDFWSSKSALRDQDHQDQSDKSLHTHLLVTLSCEPLVLGTCDTLAPWLDFNFLELRLPRLQERRDDIRMLGQYFIEECFLDIKFDFSEDAWQILEAYSWPKNVQQLKRLIQKLAIMVEQPVVSAPLLLQLFPSLDAVDRARPPPRSNVCDTRQKFVTSRSAEVIATGAHVSLELIFGSARDLHWEHPLLIKAVSYMIDNHQAQMRVAAAAASAGISAAQLADLLKQRLGLSFVQVLTKIRIEKAKALFQKIPSKPIDQVCCEIGFADIDGFEKVFKRMVGLSPKVYRGQFFKPLSLVQQ
jgi:transcriptional regulator with AAA-type ATPase domain